MVQVLKSELREAILNAACEEFAEYGYAEASVKRIADKVAISAGNLYRYFAGKEALFDAVVEPANQDLDYMINGHGEGTQAKGEGAVIDSIVQVLTDIAQKRRVQLLILIYGSKGTRHEGAMLSVNQMMANHLIGHLSAYNKKQPLEPLDEDVAMSISAAFMQGYFETIRRNSDSEACKRMIRQYLLIWYKGLQTFL
ncbi:TetR family transcriptional regulator [Paenibacillus sp. NEAU-GSW1]|nr:TetR family transcriptional regulator [Paenibacillus sp. NEAU-GSW1]